MKDMRKTKAQLVEELGQLRKRIAEPDATETEQKHSERARQQPERELSILNQVAQVFLTSPDEEIFEQVLQIVLDTLASEYGVFGYIDEEGSLVCPSMTRGTWEQCQIPDKDIVFPSETWGGIWGRALKEKKTLYSNKPFRVPKGHIPIDRAMDVPIIHRGEVIGNLLVGNKPTDYDEQDKELLETIARYIAPVLNARLERDRKEKERKLAENALRESEERLRIAGKVAYDLTYEWDITNDVLEWFGDIDGLLGYRKGEIARDIKSWLDLIHPEDRVELEKAVDFHRTSTEPIQYEYRVRHKDSTYRYWNDHALPLLDDEGRPYKWVGVCTDITERKKFENALQQNETNFRDMVDSLPDGLIIADSQGKHLFVNRRMAEITGYSIDELLSIGIEEITLPEEIRKYKRRYKQRIKGEVVPSQYERAIVRKNGTIVQTEITTTTTQWQGQACGLAILHDITERKLTAERIRLETETLTLINKLNAAANRGDSLEEIIELFDHLARDIFSVDQTTVYLLSNEKTHLVMQNIALPLNLHRQIEKLIGGRIPEVRIHLSPGGAYKTILDGRIGLITNDPGMIQQMMTECTENEALRKLVPAISRILNYTSVISVPLVIDDEPIGLVDMSRREPFTNLELERFDLLAVQLTEILHRKQIEESIHQYLEELAYNQRLLLALSRAAEAVQRAHTPEAVYEAISKQTAGLGFDITVFSLSEDREFLTLSHLTLASNLVQTAEKLTGLSAKGYRFPIKPRGFFWKIIQGGETVFTHLEVTPFLEALPKRVHPVAEKLADLIAWRESILAPLVINGEVQDLLVVTGSNLTEHAVPAVTAFANQAAIAIENARLLHETKQLAIFNDNIIQNMAEGIIVENSEGYFTFVNPSAAAMVGLEPHELIGSHESNIVPEDQYAIVQAANERRLRGETDRYELELVHKDGHRIPIIVSVTPRFEQEDFQGSIAVFTDRTEFKRAEEERKRLLAQLHAQAQQLGQVMRTIPQGVLLLGSDHRIILANPVAEEQLAILVEGKTDEKISHLGDRQLVELLTTPTSKGTSYEVKAGSQIFEVIARPMEEVEMTGNWVLVIRNVTLQREIQARLQQQGQLAVVGQLASGIAHDFSNILSVITLYTEMGLGTPDVHPRLQVHLQTILKQARTASDLIQQILDFSRRTVIEQRPMDLVPFVKEAIKLLERTVPENIKMSLDYGTDEYTVYADPTRLQQVIMNLVVNARDAMPDRGELRITLSRSSGQEEIQCMGCRQSYMGEWVHLDVSDTGSGISPGVLPHIFEPFFSTKPAGLGTGLGLAQVYGIVEKHEGHVHVTTKEGEGTKFTIYLPALAAHSTTDPVTDALDANQGKGEVILVVEDDQILREALTDSLKILNYQVLQAADGAEALGILEQHEDEVALVMSDLVMPKMGGKALLEAMRKRDIALPVVILSGHSLESEISNLQTLGLAGWMLKPPNIEQISQMLAQVLQLPSN
ncbi:MAG: PAS domain S-box protein [Anaerolineales bacterium]